ncbi:ATP-binding protein [Actinomyces timonensis]|uniref:ATP-binding protein n=1 Tax=Actinomyces timonensis TaxID=1288391 RepID=UPI00030D5A44|nr:ATP-binding protein [Actinomyces timonensis]
MAASAAPFAADTGLTSASQQKRTGVVNRMLLDGTNQDAYQIILIMGASAFALLFELMHQQPSLLRQVVEAPTWYKWGAGYPFLCAPAIPLILCPTSLLALSRRFTTRSAAAASGARLGAKAYLTIHVWTCLATAFLHHLDTAQPHLVSGIHVLPTFALVVPAALLSSISTWRTSVCGLGALFILELYVRATIGNESTLTIWSRSIYSAVLAGAYSLPISWLIERARQLDHQEQRNSLEESHIASLGARLAGSRHARNLAHNHILAALVSAFPERGTPAQRLRSVANDALSLMEQPESGHDAHNTAELIDQLRSWCWQQPQTYIEYDVHPATFPENDDAGFDITEDEYAEILAAALEALRNVASHASGKNVRQHVRCTASIYQSADTFSLSIADDGVGFDINQLSPLRLGLKNSIIARMQSLSGGDAFVSSAIGSGTSVTLELKRATTAVPAEPSLPLTGEGLSATVHGSWGRIGIAVILLSCWLHVARAADSQIHLYASVLCATATTITFTLFAWPPTGRTRIFQQYATLICVALGVIPFLVWGPVTPTLELASWPQGHHGILMVILLHQHRWRLMLTSHSIAAMAHTIPVLVLHVSAMPFVRSMAFQSINILTVATVIALVRSIEPRITAMQRQAHQAQVLRTARQARLEAETTLLADVSQRSRPVLEQLSSLTDAPSDALVQLARRVEAELRDLIRVPRLAGHPSLGDAVRQARDRGVDVIQLDDSQQDTDLTITPPPLPTTLVDTATRMLHRAKNGESVVLRLCPQHSPYAATIQCHSAAGAIALERIRRTS